MSTPVHYTLGRDRTRLAWRSRGEGPLVLMTTGVSVSETMFLPLLGALTPHARVVTWDFAGHGDSDRGRDLEGMTIPGVVHDLQRVFDATGEEQAVLVGFSVGCQITLEAWRRFPERIRAMVLLLGTPGTPLMRFLSPSLGPLSAQLLQRLPSPLFAAILGAGATFSPVPFHVARALGAVEPWMRHQELAPFIHHLGALDAASFKHLTLAAQAHDARDVLPTVSVPTLVVAGGTDVFTPPDVGQAMGEGIPGAETVYLPEAGHAGLIGHSQQINEAVLSFLRRRELL